MHKHRSASQLLVSERRKSFSNCDKKINLEICSTVRRDNKKRVLYLPVVSNALFATFL